MLSATSFHGPFRGDAELGSILFGVPVDEALSGPLGVLIGTSLRRLDEVRSEIFARSSSDTSRRRQIANAISKRRISTAKTTALTGFDASVEIDKLLPSDSDRILNVSPRCSAFSNFFYRRTVVCVVHGSEIDRSDPSLAYILNRHGGLARQTTDLLFDHLSAVVVSRSSRNHPGGSPSLSHDWRTVARWTLRFRIHKIQLLLALLLLRIPGRGKDSAAVGRIRSRE